MTRYLKALGLAVLAVGAFSAFSAASASAVTHDFECGVAATETCWLTGEQEGKHVFETNTGAKLECNVAKFQGTGDNTEDSVTIKPTYEGCTFAGEPATVTFEGGCDYLFTGETDANGDAEVHVCQTGSIKLKVFGGICTMTVGAQTRRGVHYDNVQTEKKPEEVTVTATVKGITFTKSGICIGAGSEAEYRGNTTLAGYKDLGVDEKGNPVEGAQVNITTTEK